MNYLDLSNEELCALAKAGDENALVALYDNNKGFLINQMAEIEAERSIQLTDKENLLQAGFVGIWKAVKKYDDDKDAGFLTYAAYWIRREMFREAISILKSVREELCALNRSDPDSAVDDEYLADPAAKHFPRKLFNIYGDPESIAIQNVMIDEMRRAYNKLDERTRTLVDARYGLSSGKAMSFRTISVTYNIFIRKANERVKQGLAYMKREICRRYHERIYIGKLLDEIRKVSHELYLLQSGQGKQTKIEKLKPDRASLPEELKESA